MSCQFLASIVISLSKKYKSCLLWPLLRPYFFKTTLRRIKMFLFFSFSLYCVNFIVSPSRTPEGKFCPPLQLVNQPKRLAGPHFLPKAAPAEILGCASKHQQKVRFLTISAFWISACKVWWKERVSSYSLQLRLSGESICRVSFLHITTLVFGNEHSWF